MCIKRGVLDYLNWLHSDLLKNYYTRTVPIGYPKGNPFQYCLYSHSQSVFTEIYSLWYTYKNEKRIKKVPTRDYLLVNFI